MIHGRETETKIDLTLTDFLGLLWQKKIILVMSAAIGGIIGAVYLSMATPMYKSTATFFVEEEKSQLPSVASFLTKEVSDIKSKIIEIGNSRRFKFQVSSRIIESYPNIVKKKLELFFDENTNKQKKVSRLTSVINYNKNMEFNIRGSGMMSIMCQSSDPELALIIIQEALTAIQNIYEEVGLSAKRNIVYVLDSPTQNNVPVWPHTIPTIIAGMFMGIILASLTVLIRLVKRYE